jgi:hypothetical protein
VLNPSDDAVQDNNVPLIGEVERAFLEWQVRDMTKIYSKVYLDDVAQRLFAKDGQGRISEREVGEIIDRLVSTVGWTWQYIPTTDRFLARSDKGNFTLKSPRIKPILRDLS